MKYTKLHYLFFMQLLVLMSQSVHAQKREKAISFKDYKKYVEETRISYFYKKGPFLIYNCEKKYFACVNDDGADRCDEFFHAAKVDNAKGKGCLRIKTYKNQKSCFKGQYGLIEKTGISKYCVRELRKK